jgi:hypothetical protein
MRATILAKTTLLLATLFATSASAQKEAPRFTDQIRGVLVNPTEAKHRAIHGMLQERDVLGIVRSILSPLRLPRQLTIEIKGCDGNETTYYDDGVVTFCYEYVELLQRHSPRIATPGGVPRADALFGAIIDTLLHEAGHGIFDILETPVLGREEDAADFFSAYIMLQFPFEHAWRLFEGVAFMFSSEARTALEQPFGIREYAGEHGLAPQRYYRFVCMAHGLDPQAFAEAAIDAGLSLRRQDGCVEEFALQRRAFDQLIIPHMDGAMREKTRAEIRFGWRPLLSSVDKLDPQPLGKWMARSPGGRSRARPSRP